MRINDNNGKICVRFIRSVLLSPCSSGWHQVSVVMGTLDTSKSSIIMWENVRREASVKSGMRAEQELIISSCGYLCHNSQSIHAKYFRSFS